MTQNFDKLQNEILKKEQGQNKSLLLHACCAPCATYCLKKLATVFDVTLFFSNDNVMPQEEFDKRFQALEKLVHLVNSNLCEIEHAFEIKLVKKPFDNEKFTSFAQNLSSEKEGGARCTLCYQMRLESAFEYATKNNFDYFCSTLSISPHKNAELLNKIGFSLENDTTKWLVNDFKKNDGFLFSTRFCKTHDIYRQTFCGCDFSKNSQIN